MISREGFVAIIFLWSRGWSDVECYSFDMNSNHNLPHEPITRRDWLRSNMLISSVSTSFCLSSPFPSEAKTIPASRSNPLNKLIDAQETLGILLANYNRATVDCTFADVPRELLEAKNKDLLLEKASTFALFDKSVSVESCKTTNRIVRDYLGVTGKGERVGGCVLSCGSLCLSLLFTHAGLDGQRWHLWGHRERFYLILLTHSPVCVLWNGHVLWDLSRAVSGDWQTNQVWTGVCWRWWPWRLRDR